MVLERAELPITSGREQEFESQFATAGALLRAAKGCLGLTLSRGVENPSRYLLLIEWDSVEAHESFTRTEEFKRFGAIAGPFFAGKPNMEHFAPATRL